MKAHIFRTILNCLVLLVVGCTSNDQKYGIIFSANVNGNQDLYRMTSPDFKTIQRLTFTPKDLEEGLRVTKDGNRILFFVPKPSQESILSMNPALLGVHPHSYILDLKAKTTLELGDTFGFYIALPVSWSIDEKQVVLQDSDSEKIYAVNPDEKTKKEIIFPITEGAYLNGFGYSPDGQQIAYTEHKGYANSGEFALVNETPFIYDIKTKSRMQLSDGSADCMIHQWSPTRKQILVFCNLSTNGETVTSRLHLFDITINENAVIAKQVGEFHCALFIAAWSPTGKQFAAPCQTNNDLAALVIFNSDGNVAKKLLIDSSTRVDDVSWSPDGKQIIYIAGGTNENSKNIYITNTDGTDNHAITTQSMNYRELSIYKILP